jgi:hypothetical protein
MRGKKDRTGGTDVAKTGKREKGRGNRERRKAQGNRLGAMGKGGKVEGRRVGRVTRV